MAPLARALRAAVLAVTALAAAAGAPRDGALAVTRAAAEEDWMAEFEAVCSRTQDAMSLPTDELRGLVVRCDRLRPRIDGLDASRRKVYQRRLQLCRDLYQFVLDSRAAG